MNTTKLSLGAIFVNDDRHEQISIEFLSLDENRVWWELLSNGEVHSCAGTIKGFEGILKKGKFQYDRTEMGC
jgi:hypothetical protein